MADKEYNRLDIPLNGKLNTVDDPTKLTASDFVSLKNFRYTPKGIEGVSGMTKINTTNLSYGLPAQYAGVRAGHHFHKDFPAVEDHVLVHAVYEGTSDVSCLFDSDSTVPIPGQDTFTSLMHSTNTAGTTTTMKIADAPNGSVVVCDGVSNYIWSGNEHRVGAVIASTADITTTITNPADRTEAMLNSDILETLTLGVDSYTKALYHSNGADGGTTITDSSGNSHTGTCAGNANTDTGYLKFGTSSLQLDGTDDYVSVGDSGDFYFGTGDFTIDFWVKFGGFPSPGNQQTFISQYEGVSDYWYMCILNDSGSYKLKMEFVDGASTKGQYISSALTVSSLSWFHVAFVRSGTTGYMFLDGVENHNTGVAFGANDVGNINSSLYIGELGGGSFFNGWIDELRISKGIARWTTNFTPLENPYTTYTPCAIIGSSRPLEGIKFYLITGNTITTATLTVAHWTGSAWTALTITDNTSGLETSGTVTWTSTVNSSKLRYFNGYYLYWYKVSIDSGEAQVNMITVSPALQQLSDAWDGSLRTVMACFKNTATGVYEDNSMNVVASDFTLATDTETFLNINALPNDDYVLVGFSERMTGLKITIPQTFGNDNASSMVVSYWNGIEWLPAPDTIDGTTDATKTLKQSGVVTWRSKDSQYSESMLVLNGLNPMYYYRIAVSNTLSATVYIDQVQGISAPQILRAFSVPITWRQRLFLMDEISNRRNLVIGSSTYMPEALNGDNSIQFLAGDDSAIVAASTLFTRYGSNIFDNMVIFKKKALHMVDQQNDGTFQVFDISDTVGCAAPETVARCDVDFEVSQGISRHVVMWQSDHGIHTFDSNSIGTVSNEISNFFDPTSSDYINVSIMDKFKAFFDPHRGEYHWLFATGSNTTLNKEFVFSLKDKKWFEIPRGTKPIQCGFTVRDSNGGSYCYGGLSTGYIERLENGTSFDGAAIDYEMQLADPPLGKSMFTETEVRHVKLTGLAKTTTAQKVSLNWYLDGDTTAMTPVPASKSQSIVKRFYMSKWSLGNAQGICHSPKFTISTTDETIGFIPLFVSYLFKVLRTDV